MTLHALLRILILSLAGITVGCASNQSARQVGENAKELGSAFENSTGKALEWSGDKIDRGVTAVDNSWQSADKNDGENDRDKKENDSDNDEAGEKSRGSLGKLEQGTGEALDRGNSLIRATGQGADTFWSSKSDQ